MFRPSGWDNEKKIAILYENIQSVSPDDDYNDVIVGPVSSKVSLNSVLLLLYFNYYFIEKPLQKEVEITSEDDQVFLLKMQSQLNQQTPPGTNPVNKLLFC